VETLRTPIIFVAVLVIILAENTDRQHILWAACVRNTNRRNQVRSIWSAATVLARIMSLLA
jgi:hypothetical protein